MPLLPLLPPWAPPGAGKPLEGPAPRALARALAVEEEDGTGERVDDPDCVMAAVSEAGSAEGVTVNDFDVAEDALGLGVTEKLREATGEAELLPDTERDVVP